MERSSTVQELLTFPFTGNSLISGSREFSKVNVGNIILKWLNVWTGVFPKGTHY